MAKLADAQDSGSCGKPCGFESLHPHQKKNDSRKVVVLFLVKAHKGLELRGSRRLNAAKARGVFSF